jgi:hypothetical protein
MTCREPVEGVTDGAETSARLTWRPGQVTGNGPLACSQAPSLLQDGVQVPIVRGIGGGWSQRKTGRTIMAEAKRDPLNLSHPGRRPQRTGNARV